MDVEIAHSVFEPGRQFVRRHERTGNLAGPANLLDRKADPLRDGLRPRLPERRGRRIPHVLGEIAGPMKNTSIPSTASSSSMSSIALGVSIMAMINRLS